MLAVFLTFKLVRFKITPLSRDILSVISKAAILQYSTAAIGPDSCKAVFNDFFKLIANSLIAALAFFS